jgi:hypothetical protein
LEQHLLLIITSSSHLLPAKSKHQPLEKNALHPPRGENATAGGLLLLLLLPLSFISAVQE